MTDIGLHKYGPFVDTLRTFAQMVSFLTCVGEARGSNLDQDTEYPEIFCGLNPFLQANAKTVS
jgi:hypothetical protein